MLAQFDNFLFHALSEAMNHVLFENYGKKLTKNIQFEYLFSKKIQSESLINVNVNLLGGQHDLRIDGMHKSHK